MTAKLTGLKTATPSRLLSRRTFLATTAGSVVGLALPNADARVIPVKRGYRVPLDSVPHTRTWMAWPDSRAIWGSALDGAQANIALVARTIANYEPVVLCANAQSTAKARSACGSDVEVIDEIPVDDCWMRDTGPIFRINSAGGLDAVGLNFNGWGGKQTHSRDALVARRVAALVGVPFTAAGFVSEGGAIETDGHGTLMATRSSILNPDRNPERTSAEIEAAMCAAYGAEKVIWFPGIVGKDITDDHVDGTSRFLASGRAMVQYPALASDHNIWSQDERQQYDILSASRDAHHKPVRVTRLTGPIWRKLRQHRHPGFV
ncbi:MAG: agmatine deiminase family protein, partial [Pseudonocardiales bacterium]|nr:agmatine deiminase family protein [Pseudonocardiales bacterium]